MHLVEAYTNRMSESFAVELGKFLREKREIMVLSQEHLATQVGLTRVAIANIEAGRNMPNLIHTLTICRILGVKYDEVGRIYDRVAFQESKAQLPESIREMLSTSQEKQ